MGKYVNIWTFLGACALFLGVAYGLAWIPKREAAIPATVIQAPDPVVSSSVVPAPVDDAAHNSTDSASLSTEANFDLSPDRPSKWAPWVERLDPDKAADMKKQGCNFAANTARIAIMYRGMNMGIDQAAPAMSGVISDPSPFSDPYGTAKTIVWGAYKWQGKGDYEAYIRDRCNRDDAPFSLMD